MQNKRQYRPILMATAIALFAAVLGVSMLWPKQTSAPPAKDTSPPAQAAPADAATPTASPALPEATPLLAKTTPEEASAAYNAERERKSKEDTEAAIADETIEECVKNILEKPAGNLSFHMLMRANPSNVYAMVDYIGKDPRVIRLRAILANGSNDEREAIYRAVAAQIERYVREPESAHADRMITEAGPYYLLLVESDAACNALPLLTKALTTERERAVKRSPELRSSDFRTNLSPVMAYALAASLNKLYETPALRQNLAPHQLELLESFHAQVKAEEVRIDRDLQAAAESIGEPNAFTHDADGRIAMGRVEKEDLAHSFTSRGSFDVNGKRVYDLEPFVCETALALQE